MRPKILASLVLLLAGCVQSLAPRTCQSDDDCLQGGGRGSCMAAPSSATRYCVFPSTHCSDGEWGMLSGDGLAQTCYTATGKPPDAGGPDAAAPPDASTAMTLAIDPTTEEDFGAVVLGRDGAERAFTVSNSGAPTGMLVVTMAGANRPDFITTVDTCSGASLTSTGTCTIKLLFRPTGTGRRTASLGIAASPGGLVLATMTGTGLRPGNLNIDPSSQEFAPAPVGADGAIMTFTVRNTGETATTPLEVSLAGDDFTITQSGCTGALAGLASCSISVLFRPAAAGTRNGTLVVRDAEGGSVAAQLVGAGLSGAALTLSPARHDFGSISIGGVSAPFDFTVKNTGGVASGAPLVALRDAGEFTLAQNGCHDPLAPGASCTVSVAFTPSTTDGGKGTALQVSASPGGDASADLAGLAVAKGALSLAAGAPFGAVAVGGESPELGFTVTNSGGSPVSSILPMLSGAQAGSFRVGTNGCAEPLAPSSSCTVGVIFAPQAVGALSASLTVSAPSAGSAAVGVSGTGTATLTVEKAGAGGGTVTSTPAGIDCGDACAASFSSAEVTLAAQPDALSVLSSWSGAGCSGTGACVVTLAGDATVTATFARKPPALGITPASQDFGAVTLGGQSSQVTFTVKNSGGSTSGTLSASASDASYTLGGTCAGATVAAGASCTVTVRFTPTGDAGPKPATLTVSAQPGGSVMSSLTGTALTPGQLEVSPSTWDFGTQARDSTSAEKLFTITNSGQSATGTFGASLSDTTSYSISSNDCPTTLAAMATCKIGVKFAPTTVGLKQGVSLSVSASPGGNAAASLQGTGTATVDVTNAGGGTVTSTPSGVSCGATCSAAFSSTPVSLAAAADASHSFLKWTGACTNTTTTCSVALDAATKAVTAVFGYKLTISKTGTGSGTVTASTGAIDCGSVCSDVYASGASVMLTAAAGGTSVFSGWSGGGCSGTGSCTVTMSAAKTVTAQFDPSYTLTVTLSGTGSGAIHTSPGTDLNCTSGTCTKKYAAGTVLTISHTSNAGSAFLKWSCGSAYWDRTCSVTMSANKTVTAQFDPAATMMLTGSVGTGTLTTADSVCTLGVGQACTVKMPNSEAVFLFFDPPGYLSNSPWGTRHILGSWSSGSYGVTFGYAALEVLISGTGKGSVVSSPAGINCDRNAPTPCTNAKANFSVAQWASGITLTPAPTSGSVNGGWTYEAYAAGCTTGNPCTLIQDATTVTYIQAGAVFNLP